MHPSLELFQRADVHSLPVSPLSLLAAMKVPVLTYGQYSQAAGKSLSYLLGRFGPDGMTFPIDGRLTVFYNELNDPGRIRWTLAHELSHILLHYRPEKRGPLFPSPAGKKDPMEREADQLAKEILGPLVVLHFCGVSSRRELRELTGFSHEAADYRFAELEAFRRQRSAIVSRDDLRLFLQFEPFITAYIAQKAKKKDSGLDIFQENTSNIP